jgi:hypothetical protein
MVFIASVHFLLPFTSSLVTYCNDNTQTNTLCHATIPSQMIIFKVFHPNYANKLFMTDLVPYVVALGIFAAGIYALCLIFAEPVPEPKASEITMTIPRSNVGIILTTVSAKAKITFTTVAQGKMRVGQEKKRRAAEMSKLQDKMNGIQAEIDELEDKLVDYVKEEDVELLN